MGLFRLNLKTVFMVADKLLCRLEILHTKCYIHRDIKPDNFLMGKGLRKHMVYVIDFGLGMLSPLLIMYRFYIATWKNHLFLIYRYNDMQYIIKEVKLYDSAQDSRLIS